MFLEEASDILEEFTASTFKVNGEKFTPKHQKLLSVI
jgi:hypothetical protein